MTNIKVGKSTFDNKVSSYKVLEKRMGTVGCHIRNYADIKLSVHVSAKESVPGRHVINVSEQKRKEAYQKINRMLGGI